MSKSLKQTNTASKTLKGMAKDPFSEQVKISS
jgi:hypothetical protein